VKLFTHALSPFSAKVRIALDEKKLGYEEIALPITRQGIVSKPREFLALNPRGEVPVLVDGDVSLYDSTVILEYLNERYPQPPLLPDDVAMRARARLLEDSGDWYMNTAVSDLIAEVFRKTDPTRRDAARLADAAARIGRGYDGLEALLDGRDWLCGEFGIADIGCFLPASFATTLGVPPGEGHVRVGAWLARLNARPSVARDVASMTRALQELPD
jgi:glutathione S-transferase